jgi:arylsulfatase A-like enzyme
VLLITLDTTRADRVGCYGYARAQTPTLDALAASGMRFTRAFTNVPLTLPAHATLMTGLLPPEHGIHLNGGNRLPDRLPTLAQVLSEHGYRTAAFVASSILAERFGLHRGFQVYSDDMSRRLRAGDAWEMETPADVVCDRALGWLRVHGASPFFLWVHFFDPHLPYEPPDAYSSSHREPYDGEISFMDAQVGRLVTFLKDEGLDRTTLVVAVGDHGEAFGEHEETGHGRFLFNTTLHVPLLLSLPGRLPESRVVDDVVSLVDLARTILDVVGLDAPRTMGGRSVLKAAGRGRGCYGETAFRAVDLGQDPVYSLTTRRWKLILGPETVLFDLEQDPRELTDLASAQPQTARRLEAMLADARNRMTRVRAPALKPDEETIRALESLGYAGGGVEADGR